MAVGKTSDVPSEFLPSEVSLERAKRIFIGLFVQTLAVNVFNSFVLRHLGHFIANINIEGKILNSAKIIP